MMQDVPVYYLFGRPIVSRIWSIDWRHFPWAWMTPTQISGHANIRCWMCQ